jgi:predicted phage terminase large subunit-like protein
MRRGPTITEKQFDLKAEELRALIRTHVSAFEGDTAQSKADRIAHAKTDREFFCRTYFPHYFTCASAPMHAEMDRLLEVTEDPVAVAAARGFSKSTRVSFANPLHAICFERRRFIILVQCSLDLARPLVMAIRMELEENARIRSDFGDLRGQPWSDDEIVTANGIKVLARGARQAIRGLKHGPHRPDLIVLDDIEDDEHVRNPEQVKRLLAWVREAVLPSLDPQRGTLFWVGTLLSRKSALAQILTDAAWIHARLPGENPDGTSAWPERFPDPAKLRWRLGSAAYVKEVLLAPGDDEAALFQEAWLVRYRASDIAGQAHVVKEAIDPSLGRSETSDFRAFVKGGQAADGYIYLRRPDIRRVSLDTIVRTAYARQLEEAATEIFLAETGFLGLELYFRTEGEKRHMHLPLRMVKETEAKESRIAAVSPLVERGIVRFLQDDPMTDLLIEQLLAFPSPTVNDDGPDALATLCAGLTVAPWSLDGAQTSGVLRDTDTLSAYAGRGRAVPRSYV